MYLTKFLKSILIFTIIIASLSSTVLVRADAGVYTPSEYWMPIPQPFTLVNTIIYIEGLDKQLNTPTDIFIRNNEIYIVDSKNSRIVKIDNKGTLLGVYEGEYGLITKEQADQELEKWKDGIEKNDQEALHYKRVTEAKIIRKLNNPQGIYVDKDGDMYIADTDNYRVVHLGPDGKFVEIFHEPHAETYDRKYPFKPTKVYIDAVNKLYVINNKDYHGLVSLDANNEFLGYLGASKVEKDLIYQFYKIFVKNEEDLMDLLRITPPYFTNFVINENDQLMYAVQMDAKENQIQILTPAGENVYAEGIYGGKNLNSYSSSSGKTMFVDIAVSPEGIIYAADNGSKSIFVYDQEGNNLAIFGGEGRVKEKFTNISSIAYDEGYLYVCDLETNLIQIFKATDFMQKVNKASALYNQGKYDEAEPYWKQVLEINSTYEMAIKGISKSLFRQGKYAEAMEESLKIDDRLGYSEAFYEYRLDKFRNNFGWVVLAILVLIAVLFIVIKYLYKLAKKVDEVYDYSNDKFGIKLFFHTALMVLLHPIDGFNKLKYQRDRYKWYHAIVLVILIIFVRVAYIYMVHFPLADTLPQQTDFLREVLKLFVPIGLWMVLSYALTTIMDGKTKFMEAVAATLYSFVPYIVFQLPLAILSNVMSIHESGLYNALTTIVLLWCIALILLNTMQLNEYSFPKLVGSVLLTLFGILCTLVIAGMFYLLILQFLGFIKEVNEEILFLIR